MIGTMMRAQFFSIQIQPTCYFGREPKRINEWMTGIRYSIYVFQRNNIQFIQFQWNKVDLYVHLRMILQMVTKINVDIDFFWTAKILYLPTLFNFACSIQNVNIYLAVLLKYLCLFFQTFFIVPAHTITNIKEKISLINEIKVE